MRFHFLVLVLMAASALTSTVQAGILVGSRYNGPMGGNDSFGEVKAEILEYNASNDPDLIDPDLLGTDPLKTDDDAALIFNPSNGFAFYSDAGGNNAVGNEAGLTALSMAWFEYTGNPDDLNVLFFSVKSSNGFSLYTVMGGLNKIDFIEESGGDKEISHVSFWSGPPGLDEFGVPEPMTAVMLSTGALVLMASTRRRRA